MLQEYVLDRIYTDKRKYWSLFLYCKVLSASWILNMSIFTGRIFISLCVPTSFSGGTTMSSKNLDMVVSSLNSAVMWERMLTFFVFHCLRFLMLWSFMFCICFLVMSISTSQYLCCVMWERVLDLRGWGGSFFIDFIHFLASLSVLLIKMPFERVLVWFTTSPKRNTGDTGCTSTILHCV